MLILGIKVTHDGGVALIDGDRLVFSVEMEKRGNGTRFAELGDLDVVAEVLDDYDVKPGDLDLVSVDGWGYGDIGTRSGGADIRLGVAPYREQSLGDDSLRPHEFDGLRLLPGTNGVAYQSFPHTTGHVMSAYCASPFGAAGEPSFVLVWDGGVVPRCYYVRPEAPHIENLGPIFGLMGNVYAVFSMHFGPFRMEDPFLIEAPGDQADRGEYNQRRLSVPGKVMAYTALGQVREDLVAAFGEVYRELDPTPEAPRSYPEERPFVREFMKRFLDRVAAGAPEPADLLASFQYWLGNVLVGGLRRMRAKYPDRTGNLCFAGGCALNIKWNSAIRRSGVFDRFWVPPFPNDSGAAIGAACAAMVRATGVPGLGWEVYQGPELAPAAAVAGYRGRPCDLAGLARILHAGEPVVVLHGRAELGPRALGNRSIIAAATDPAMKDTLNAIKRREDYRPVSPICLEHRAPGIFDPGTPDPYMLFDHDTRPEWRERVPAVVHLDGSARLQTINAAQNPVAAELLAEYEKLSGIPVLCNTSANFEGKGFFPDAASAMRWGRCRLVWSDGTLWERDA